MARPKPPTKKKNPTANDLAKIAREATRKAEMLRRIDDFLAWTKEHPSVHDTKAGEKPWTQPPPPRDAILAPLVTASAVATSRQRVVAGVRNAMRPMTLTSASVMAVLRGKGS